MKSRVLELPAGLVGDNGDIEEDFRTAAQRELVEETGYRADSLVPLGSVNPNPALFGNRLHAFLARDARRVAEVTPGETEETVVELVELAALRDLVCEGAVVSRAHNRREADNDPTSHAELVANAQETRSPNVDRPTCKPCNGP